MTAELPPCWCLHTLPIGYTQTHAHLGVWMTRCSGQWPKSAFTLSSMALTPAGHMKRHSFSLVLAALWQSSASFIFPITFPWTGWWTFLVSLEACQWHTGGTLKSRHDYFDTSKASGSCLPTKSQSFLLNAPQLQSAGFHRQSSHQRYHFRVCSSTRLSVVTALLAGACNF